MVAFVIQWSWYYSVLFPASQDAETAVHYPYIEPHKYPNELFNQAIRCMKADIVRKPPRMELSGKDARETGG